MANRACPQCGTIAPITRLLAYSDGFECSNCHTRLEDTSGGRSIAIWVGLAAAWGVWRLTTGSGGSSGPLGDVLPELYAILAFGIVSPIVLAFTASVERAPVAPVVEVAAASGHGAGHGGGHH